MLQDQDQAYMSRISADPTMTFVGTSNRGVAEAKYADLEQRLFTGPAITVPTITIASEFDGAAADGKAYAGKFTGIYSHRVLSGIGHNVPQEDPQSFAKAIVDVDG